MIKRFNFLGIGAHEHLATVTDVRDRVASDDDFVPGMTLREFADYMDAKTGTRHPENSSLSKAVDDWNAALDVTDT